MSHIEFDQSRPLDIILFGRAAIDLNPEDMYQPLSRSTTFKKYLGGSPANIAVGMARLGKKCGFIGRISDDQFGDFVIDEFVREGVDVSAITRSSNGAKLGLTFTEVLDPDTSSILMYRQRVADLDLSPDDVREDYIASAKVLLISGTSLAESPSREAALKAMMLARKTNTPIVFDIDYREYNWRGADDIAVYYALVARAAAIILGSRAEFDLTEALIKPKTGDRESASFWMSQNTKLVVIKHGKEGSTAYTKDGGAYSVKPFPVKPLKGFGGGDGYAAAFLFGIMEGWKVPECLEIGSASASILIGSHGCSSFMPTLAEIRAFIAQSKAQHGEMVAKA